MLVSEIIEAAKLFYGCHSLLAPDNRKLEMVVLPKYYPVVWPYRFTRTCQYDNKHADIRCNKCEELKHD